MFEYSYLSLDYLLVSAWVIGSVAEKVFLYNPKTMVHCYSMFLTIPTVHL